jgi:beta-glucosidase/6-phospho-beta-glucosidase/beta-galactosidase
MPDNSVPLFDRSPEGFVFATGIEDTFVAQTERAGERVLDEYALTDHYRLWREDLDRAADLGVRAMRYGIPWYKVEPAPGRFDWEWVDQVVDYAARKSIAIIVDLVHYGTPLWLDNQFLNASYPARVAAFAHAFASRYARTVSHYTPLNEPRVTMDFCGLRGIWPPYLRGDDGAAKIARAIARGIVATIEAIRAADSRAVIVHVEAAGEWQPETPDIGEEARLLNERTFLATDLVTGRVDDRHPLVGWLLANGLDEHDIAWFASRRVGLDVIGVNYYPEMSVLRLKRTPRGLATERVFAGVDGLQRALAGFAERYRRPLFLSETSTNGTIAQRADWLSQSLAAIPALRAAGIPLVGYTWWPLFDLIDWVYRSGARPVEDFITRFGPGVLDPQQVAGFFSAMRWTSLEGLPLEAYLAPMGLYTLQRNFDEAFERVRTPLVDQYAASIAKGAASVGAIGATAMIS